MRILYACSSVCLDGDIFPVVAPQRESQEAERPWAGHRSVTEPPLKQHTMSDRTPRENPEDANGIFRAEDNSGDMEQL